MFFFLFFLFSSLLFSLSLLFSSLLFSSLLFSSLLFSSLLFSSLLFSSLLFSSLLFSSLLFSSLLFSFLLRKNWERKIRYKIFFLYHEQCWFLWFHCSLLTGCAFVTFSTRQSALNAIKALHHSTTMEVRLRSHIDMSLCNATMLFLHFGHFAEDTLLCSNWCLFVLFLFCFVLFFCLFICLFLFLFLFFCF